MGRFRTYTASPKRYPLKQLIQRRKQKDWVLSTSAQTLDQGHDSQQLPIPSPLEQAESILQRALQRQKNVQASTQSSRDLLSGNLCSGSLLAKGGTQDAIQAKLTNDGDEHPRHAVPQSPTAHLAVQRIIDGRLATKWYRRKGGSASRRVNDAIAQYNEDYRGHFKSPQDQEQALQEIETLLQAVTNPGKQAQKRAIQAEIVQERKNMQAVQDAMTLMKRRASLQAHNPNASALFANDSSEDVRAAADFVRSREVLHMTNPLGSVGNGKSVGDAIAESQEIKNVHQIKRSMFGSGDDSQPRKTAEIGLFYPQAYRRDSFNRKAQDNSSRTKGLNPDLMPADDIFPKYAAVNLLGSDFGALYDNGVEESGPLHFAIAKQVLEDRTTFTTGDSLREWQPNDDEHKALKRKGYLTHPDQLDVTRVPTDDAPWETGPVSPYGSDNLGQIYGNVIGKRTQDYRAGNRDTNPKNYMEAQIHGPLFVNRDISHVRANFAKLFGNPRFKSLYKSFERSQKPIKWYFRTKEVQIGNDLTQEWNPEQATVFQAAWQEAAQIWKRGKNIFAREIKKGNYPGLKLEDILSKGTLPKDLQPEMKEIWDRLVE